MAAEPTGIPGVKAQNDRLLVSLASAIGVSLGGTGLTTIAAGSILAANVADTLVAVTSTSGTKVLVNTNGTITWELSSSVGVTDHGALTGLGDDDHTQYVLRTILTTEGDIFYRDGAGIARLARGTNGQVLKATATSINWAAESGGVTDHGALTGLGDDDHTQYTLLAGRSGGQTLSGDTAASGNLTLQSTAHATKGKILFGTSGAYDEANGRFGVGTQSPLNTLHVKGVEAVAKIEDTTGNAPAVIWQGIAGGLAKMEFAGGAMRLFGDTGQNMTLGADGTINRLSISTSGNVALGAPNKAAGGGGPALSFAQGTDPTGIVADTAGLYAKDVAGTAELFGFDEAGNFPQLTPHNFTLFQPLLSYEYPWSYYAINKYIGWEINVDMFGAIRRLEELSPGRQFIFLRRLPPNEREEWTKRPEETPAWIRQRLN